MRKYQSMTFVFLSYLILLISATPLVWGENSWETMTPPPTPIYSNIGAAVVNEKIFFIGSQINAKYDPETYIWT